MISYMIFLSSILVLCSGQSNIKEEDKEYYVTISNMTISSGYNVDNLKAERNITKLAQFLSTARSIPPKQYDWRKNYKYNVVPEAENKNPCHTSWIFATIYMLEVQYAIHTSYVVSLSKQQVVDCLKNSEGQGCCFGAGDPKKVFDYVKNNGLQGTKSYGPYLGKNGICHHDPHKNILSVKGDLQTFSGHETFLNILYHQGPILATMIEPESYGNGGVLKIKGEQCPDRSKVNHAVLLVGYGVTRDGLKYWIAKNTYGTEFGVEKGYFKIERGRNTLCIEDYGGTAKIVV